MFFRDWDALCVKQCQNDKVTQLLYNKPKIVQFWKYLSILQTELYPTIGGQPVPLHRHILSLFQIILWYQFEMTNLLAFHWLNGINYLKDNLYKNQ